MVVHQNITNLAGYFHFLNVRKIPYVIGIAGGTIYTTTYPCELCSKKIYQAQLSRIVYTEPYPDSLSEKLFLKDGIRQISIEQFEGVKSPSFFRLFKPAFDLKEYQTIDGHGADEDL